MAIALVQQKNAHSSSSETVAATFDSNNTAGNMIVVTISMRVIYGGSHSISDSRGNTYVNTIVRDEHSGSNAEHCIQYAAYNISAGANTVTFVGSTGDDPGNYDMQIYEFSGAKTSAAFDQSASTEGDSSTPASGNVTAASDATLWVGCSTKGLGTWTQATDFSNGNLITAYAHGYRITTGGATDQYDPTSTASNPWVAQVGTYKEAAAAATSTFIPRLTLMGAG